VPRGRLEELSGGDAQENAALVREVLAGRPGPRRDVVLINAAAALVAAGQARNWKHGVELAAQSIDSGAAGAKLEALVCFSRSQES
jgi:anthranilate phosphoribosyltransferase